MVNLTALQENQPAGLFPTIHTVGQSAQFRTDNQSTLPLKWKWYVQDQCSSWYIISQKKTNMSNLQLPNEWNATGIARNQPSRDIPGLEY